jgi:hypothetical protein
VRSVSDIVFSVWPIGRSLRESGCAESCGDGRSRASVRPPSKTCAIRISTTETARQTLHSILPARVNKNADICSPQALS